MLTRRVRGVGEMEGEEKGHEPNGTSTNCGAKEERGNGRDGGGSFR